MDVDAREGRRLKLNLPVKIIVLNEDYSAGAESSGKLHDLSKGGCAFYHRSNLPVGKRVELRIRLNEALTKKLKKKELKARGAVIRSVPEAAGYLLSVRFVRPRSH